MQQNIIPYKHIIPPMTYEHITALLSYAFVMSITPGPNNFMLMTSAANFGVRRTIPHWSGVAIGFAIMTIVLGMGLSQIFTMYPITKSILGIVCATYMIWLAYKLATAAPLGDNVDEGTPLTFLQAAAFQWVNPKAVTMSLTTISVYTATNSLLNVALAALIFTSMNFPSCGTWVFAGHKLRAVLKQQRYLRIFNIGMAILLLASLVPILPSNN